MEYPSLKIGDLIVEKPLIQGGMGVGISLGGLAGAVAKEGGIGIISSAQIGFKEPDFESCTKEANIRAIGSELQRARDIAPHGVIGFNIMVALKYYDEYVKAAVEAGADLIISGAGLPTDLPSYVEGSRTKIAPIVSTEKSAKVILKYWDKKYSRTADMVVIEGPKAGGHLGFDKEQLDKFDEAAYDREVQAILAVVKEYSDKYGVKVPVALAGGIENAHDVRHAFSLGADAVQVASRFVTTKECDADTKYKERYIQAAKEDIVIVKSPVGMPGRAIRNPFMERVMSGERQAPRKCLGCLRKCNPAEIPYCITEALVNAARGDVDNALLFCGASAYRAEKIETVKEVVDSLLA
ncbi:NAD(P)H-dependent flavin oxidoreductase [Bariatricus massiliensis]|uniref:NAD(P)H-dependent flavin oxidoreductase n=1 Tax=Bariatricus massiliensis TaxID=1745713 RepID=UPI00083072DD|nr:nitronate monooxygenase family protein [Bariatricus massiliensis]